MPGHQPPGHYQLQLQQLVSMMGKKKQRYFPGDLERGPHGEELLEARPPIG
jgi:hypothetical protein